MADRLSDHVYPDAVADADDDDMSLVTVDTGITAWPCGACGNDHIHRLVEPDETAGGTFVGYGFWACCQCRTETS